MKRLLISIIPILFSGLCFAQTDINLIYSSFFGGSNEESAGNILKISSDRYLFYGGTNSNNLPVTSDALDSELSGSNSGFFTVMDLNGELIYSTFLDGSNLDGVTAAEVAMNGDIILSGYTNSVDFPLLNPANDQLEGDETIGFISRFDDNFNLVWSTYFGGGGIVNIETLVMSDDGSIYISGSTMSSDLGTSGVHQEFPVSSEIFNSYLAKLNSNGEVMWCTYISGSGLTFSENIALSEDGSRIYVTGNSFDASDHGFINAHQPESGGGSDCFLAAYSTDDGNILWGTYYGGSESENPGYVEAMENGTVLITGVTSSTENIATQNAFQEELNGNVDNFIVAFDPNGNRIWATYYGGQGNEISQTDLKTVENSIYMMGATFSNDGISIGNPYLDEISEMSESANTFLVKLDQQGQPIWATFLNQNYECARTRKFDFGENQDILAVGNFNPSSNQQACLDFISPDAYQPFYGGGDSDVGIFIYQDNTLSTIFPQAGPLNIYPNPASNFITIEIPDLLWAGMELTVADFSGRLVDQVRQFQSGNSYETSHLSNGIYILTGQVGDRFFREKLVVSQ